MNSKVQAYREYLAATGSKLPRWHFERMGLGFNDATKFDEFFNADNMDALATFIREVIQNILDAGSNTAHFAFRLVHVSQLEAFNFSEIMTRAGSVEGPVDRAKLEAQADENGYVRILEINDAGHGLTGPYHRAPRAGETPQAFVAFARGLANSSKINDHSGGSKGLGRSQIICASTIHTAAVFTRRDDGIALAFALALLNFNRYEDVDYRPYGQFLIDNTSDPDPSVPPLENDAAEAFLEALGSDRDPKARGTCIILPSIRPDFTVESFMKHLVQDHIYTILSGLLRVKVEEGDECHVLDQDSLLDYAADPRFGTSKKLSSEDLVTRIVNIKKMVASRETPRDIGKPNDRIVRASFPNELIEILAAELDAGQAVSTSALFSPRERRRGDKTELVDGRITFTAVHDPAIKNSFSVHIRDRLSTFTDLPGAGYAVMVTSQGDGVARMLRDSEDPSHTKWIIDRAAQTWPKNKADQIIPSFINGGTSFLNALTKRAENIETSGFSWMFSMPLESSQPKPDDKEQGDDAVDPVQPPKPAPPRPAVEDPDMFSVSMVPACGGDKAGFKLTLTETAREICESGAAGTVILQAAYAVTKGTPKFDSDKHSSADFDFDEFKFTSNHGRVRPIGPNAIEISNMRPEFELIGLGDFNQLRGVVFQYTKQAA